MCLQSRLWVLQHILAEVPGVAQVLFSSQAVFHWFLTFLQVGLESNAWWRWDETELQPGEAQWCFPRGEISLVERPGISMAKAAWRPQLFLSHPLHSRLSALKMVFLLLCNPLCFQKWLLPPPPPPQHWNPALFIPASFPTCCVRLPHLQFKVPENIMNSLISASCLNTSQVLYTWPFWTSSSWTKK